MSQASPPSLVFAHRMAGLAPSAVREILKVAERPEIISLAGGLPAPELFPIQALAEAAAAVLADHGPTSMQYGVTEGYGPLREWIVDRLALRGVRSDVGRLLITSGSQQGIDLVSRALLDPGSLVVTENPTYLAALQAFAASEAEVVAVGSDDDGLRVDELETLLGQRRPRLIYLCPDFQNPKGTTLATARRTRLAELARQHGVPVLEDDPYGELRFAGQTPPAIAAFDEDWIIRLGSFSKILAPGLRLGWLHGSPEVVRRLTVLKQAADLHTATFAQWVAARVLTAGSFDLDAHLERLRATYRERGGAMLARLEQTMPAGTRWTRPEGGLFTWLQLPPGVSDEAVFRAALDEGVAVVPGAGFFVGPANHGFLRLNYSNQSVSSIEAGVTRLAGAIQGVAGR